MLFDDLQIWQHVLHKHQQMVDYGRWWLVFCDLTIKFYQFYLGTGQFEIIWI